MATKTCRRAARIFPSRFFRAVFLIGLLTLGFPVAGNTQSGMQIIRDSEVEGYIRKWSEDAVRAAGMSPEQVDIVLVQSDDINAFVAGGANIFIYTGLIAKTSDPGELVAVIAHELGHIAGGHLTRGRDVAKGATFEAIAATLLGVGAAIVSGDGGAAAAGAAIGRSSATNSFLAYSRVQEASADQAGFRFMESGGINPTGMMTFLEKLSSQELLPTSQQSQFMRSHPLSRDRIELLTDKVEASPLRNKALPAGWDEDYARTKAKLTGFINPQQVAYAYPLRDQSVAARYARAIAAYRMNHVDEALGLTDKLLAEEPKNPYFLELKGQMLYEFGRAAQSVDPYAKAVALRPDAGLIRIAYAQSLLDLAGKSPPALEKVISELKRASIDEPRVSRTRRLLATAYGRMGDEARARVYLADEALMQGKKAQAASMAKSALANLPKGSAEALRAQDIVSALGD